MYLTCGTSTVPGKVPNLPDWNRNVCHSIEALELTSIHRPFYCLDGWCLALYRRLHAHHWIETLELDDTHCLLYRWIFGTSRWNEGQFVDVLDL